jgi:hypothetical protein
VEQRSFLIRILVQVQNFLAVIEEIPCSATNAARHISPDSAAAVAVANNSLE